MTPPEADRLDDRLCSALGAADERYDGEPKAPRNCRRDGNGRWICPFATRFLPADHPAVESVTAIVRKKLDISHPKLREVVHRDFADCRSALAETLSAQDAAIFCLGAYTGAVSDAELQDGNRGLPDRVRAGSPRQ